MRNLASVSSVKKSSTTVAVSAFLVHLSNFAAFPITVVIWIYDAGLVQAKL